MSKGMQKKGIVRKNKMLFAAIKLFLENGYEKTSTTMIAKTAGYTQSAFFVSFADKENLLLELTQIMFENQFSVVETDVDSAEEPLMLYAMETSLQMYITEISKPLRELYVMAYSLPNILEYIYSATAKKLSFVFGKYLPEAEPKDFYELDIASAGITRGFMAKPCDFYFTMEQKLRRYLSCCMTLYYVPIKQQQEVIEQILKKDMKTVAEVLIAQTIAKAEAGFEKITAQ